MSPLGFRVLVEPLAFAYLPPNDDTRRHDVQRGLKNGHKPV